MTDPLASGTPDIDALAAAIRAGDRSALARAITLVESTRADHRQQAQRLLTDLMPSAGSAMHIGITGVPGPGKSTTIEALGMYLIELGHRVAVLAVDPSSTRTGARSSVTRPGWPGWPSIRTPTSGRRRPPGRSAGGQGHPGDHRAAGGAGFDVILVETVGVGQSEVAGVQYGRHLRLSPRPYRRSVAGHQEGRAGTRRYRGGQQGRRRARDRGQRGGTRTVGGHPVDLSG